MQCGNASIRLVGPEEPAANAALMHGAVKIILQLEKIEGIATGIVEVIVVHLGSVKLETNCAEDPTSLAVNDGPLIEDVIVQAIFGGQVIGVFVKSLKESLVNLVNVGNRCVFQRQIWPLTRQSMGYHTTVSSDGIESGLFESQRRCFRRLPL